MATQAFVVPYWWSEHPEARRDHSSKMITGDSAHAAYFMGAQYFKIKLVIVAVGPDYRLSGKAVKKAVTRNSILVIASLPGFSHGPH